MLEKFLSLHCPGTMSEQPTICILGGGFGGLYTALKLQQLPWLSAQQPEIVLIDQNDRFLFLPLLYEWVTAELQTWEIAPPFEELLAGTSIQFRQACVQEIDADANLVKLANGTTLTYDQLVIALGAETRHVDIPGVTEYALPFRSLEHAYQLGERLRQLEASDHEDIRIVVVGGGYSGVELACKLADRLGDRGRIRLIERNAEILSNSPTFNQSSALKALEKRHVWLDLETEVEALSKGQITLNFKGQSDRLPVDLVLWTVGNQMSPLIRDLPLPFNERGQLKLQPTLQVETANHIYALGDVANCVDQKGQSLPPTAQVAVQQADYCAWNIWATLSDRPLLPFRYQPLGEMLALGSDNATLSGLSLTLDGPLAYLARRLIYLYRLPTWQHQLAVGTNWMVQPFLAWFKS